MASERNDFKLLGPSHLTTIDWKNEHHRMSVAVCLIQGVYILERDRQHKREDTQALAPPWWESFHFKLNRQLEDADFCVFGAIYEYKPPAYHSDLPTAGTPRYVIAFRGLLTEPASLRRDLEMGLRLFLNKVPLKPRFEIAMQAVRDTVASVGNSNVWLAGHSLGSSMAMIAGKTMAKTGVLLEAFLFNPLFFSAPIERIKDKRVKHWLQIAVSVITAGLARALKKKRNNNQSEDLFIVLSDWVPSLFVHRADYICSEYVRYFEQRKTMEEIGAGCIGRLATQKSLRGLFLNVMIGKESEPFHLIPSAKLIVNETSRGFKQDHGIDQWWRPDLHLQSKRYRYR